MSSCSLCGAQFDCAMAAPGRIGPAPSNCNEPCWCTLLPAAISLPSVPAAACWCRACLTQQMALQRTSRPDQG